MNVLIVDDEIYAVDALAHRVAWADLGFASPFAAYSMKQAQSIFLSTEVNLLVCDIEMPQGSGLDLFEWVKLFYPQTECIFVTCHDEYHFLRSAMQLGSCDYILKPVDYDELTNALKEAVSRITKRRHPSVSDAQTQRVTLPVEEGIPDHPYISQMIQYITDHLSEPVSIGELADHMHLNPQYAMRIFKRDMGCSILQFITAKRIALAVKYLEETSLSVTEISTRCGFDNYSYFTRIFKRFTNSTPTSYRKNTGS